MTRRVELKFYLYQVGKNIFIDSCAGYIGENLKIEDLKLKPGQQFIKWFSRSDRDDPEYWTDVKRFGQHRSLDAIWSLT